MNGSIEMDRYMFLVKEENNILVIDVLDLNRGHCLCEIKRNGDTNSQAHTLCQLIMIFRPEKVIVDYFGISTRLWESMREVSYVYSFRIDKSGEVIYFDKKYGEDSE